LLCDTDATRVLTDAEAVKAANSAARIQIGSSAASPLAVVGIGSMQATGVNGATTEAVVIRTGGVWRLYETPQAREFLRWITDELPPEG
jgi:hypothetical protein